MINPRAKVYLEWSTMKEVDIDEKIRETQSSCISGRDMVIPEEASRFFGIYHMDRGTACSVNSCFAGIEPIIFSASQSMVMIYHRDRGNPRNLAMPLYHWGKFYEQLIRTIMNLRRKGFAWVIHYDAGLGIKDAGEGVELFRANSCFQKFYQTFSADRLPCNPVHRTGIVCAWQP